MKRTAWIAIVTCIVLAGGEVTAGDWPNFRGPNYDGISDETGLLDSWPAAGPKELWRTKLGEGYSAVSVAAGNLYTLFSTAGDTYAISLDAATGKERWRVRIDKAWKDGQGNGPRSTPTVDGNVVYVVSGHGKLYALATADGKQLWHVDLKSEYEARIPRWGFSCSPVIDGDRLLLEVGGTGALLAAFNKKTGKEIWLTEDDKPGYSTPLIIDVDGTRQALFFSGTKIYAVSPSNGALHWSYPWKTDWDVNAAMPVQVAPKTVFFASGYDTGAALFKIGKNGAEEIWKTRDMKNQFSSSVFHDGYLYGFNNKILQCVDAKTGTRKWQARDLGHGSLIYADGNLIVLGEQGQLALVEATPDGYREKSEFQLFKSKTWTAPTLSGGVLYVRDEHELVALDVSG